MAYGKTSILVRYSDNSDYSDPQIVASLSDEYTSASEKIDLTLGTTTAGVTVTLSSFSTIKSLVVANTDSTRTITATWNSAGTTGNTCVIPAGEEIKLVDVTASGNLVLACSSSNGAVARVIAYGI